MSLEYTVSQKWPNFETAVSGAQPVVCYSGDSREKKETETNVCELESYLSIIRTSALRSTQA